MDNFKNTIGWVLLVPGCAIGLGFLAVFAYFYWKYFVCSGIGCSELLMGPALASLFAVLSFIAASFGAFFVGSKIHKYIRYFVYIITSFTFTIFVYFLLFG
jgi:hypothetical protein